jgi:CRP-like cAMP-binding protein
MSEDSHDDGLRARLTRQGEDAIGRLAQELLENPMITGALTRAFDARQKASQAQELAMGALNLPSAADLERLTRRLRSVSQRLEGIEEGLDRVDQRLEAAGSNTAIEGRLIAIEADLERLATKLDQAVGTPRAGTAKAPGRAAGERRLKAIEQQVSTIAHELHGLREDLPVGADPVPTRQERLKVGEPAS